MEQLIASLIADVARLRRQNVSGYVDYLTERVAARTYSLAWRSRATAGERHRFLMAEGLSEDEAVVEALRQVDSEDAELRRALCL